jgi:hypothetical protein
VTRPLAPAAVTRCRHGRDSEPSRVVGTFVNGITKMGAARSRSLRSIKARSRTSSGTRRRPLERAKAAVRCWCAACPPQGRWWATDDGFGLGGEHEAFEHGGRRDRRAVLAAISRDSRAVSGVPDHIGASKRRSIAWARSSMRRRSTATRVLAAQPMRWRWCRPSSSATRRFAAAGRSSTWTAP